jgi:hypothetical protein
MTIFMATGMLSVRILYQILNRTFAFHALIKEETRKIFTGELNALATTVLQATAKTFVILCFYLLLLTRQVTLSATTCNSACTCVKLNYYSWSIT